MLGVRILDGYASSRASRRRQADIIRLLLLTGCRKGEIVNLRWREVEGDTLNLGDGKTGPRKVFLNTSARAVIERQPRTDSPFVFPSPRDPERACSPNLPLWYSVRRQAGIEDVRLHDLRHSCASWPDFLAAKEVIKRCNWLSLSLFPKPPDIAIYNPKSYSHRIHSNI